MLALLSTQPLTWAATLVSTIVMPRYLGDHGLGQLALVASVATICGTVALLGVPSYLVRRVALNPARAAIDATAAMVLTTSLAAVVAVVASVVLSLAHFPMAGTWPMRLALAGMVVTVFSQGLFSTLNGQERHAWYAWLNATAVVANVSAGIAVLAAGGSITALMAVSLTITGLVTAIGGYFAGFRFRREALDLTLIREIARGSMAFFGQNVLIKVRAEVDRIPLALLAGVNAVGWYAAAYRIVSIPLFIPTLVMTPLLPILSRNADDREVFQHTLRRSVFTTLLLTIPICAAVVGLAPAVPEVVGWPSDLDNSVPLMMILAVQVPLISLDMVLGTALIALRRERVWITVMGVAAVFNIAANVVLIPVFDQATGNGAVGAAVATVMTEVMLAGAALILLPRGMLDRRTALVGVRVTAAAAAGAVVAHLLLSWSLPLAIVGCGATIVGLGAALRVVRPADVRAIVDLVARRRDGRSRD
jgi:O-antigen/teichoic acid export membrane protein